MPFVHVEDYDAAMVMCNWHRNEMTQREIDACNDVARAWGNNEAASRDSISAFTQAKARLRAMVDSGQRAFWCGCERCLAAAKPLPRQEIAKPKNSQQLRQEAILANLPTADVDAWIINNMGYTAERLAAISKTTRRDVRREARRAMS